MVGECDDSSLSVDSCSILAVATSLPFKGKFVLYKYTLNFFIVHSAKLGKEISSRAYSFCEEFLTRNLYNTKLQ